jgi:hypothetical protein
MHPVAVTAQPRGRFPGQDAGSDLLTADLALAQGPVVNFLQSYGNFVLELEQSPAVFGQGDDRPSGSSVRRGP